MSIELYSEFKFDKFIFKIMNRYLYSTNHLWFDFDETGIIIGLTDYLQQTIGDAAFVTLPLSGAIINPSVPISEIETMKVNHEIMISYKGIILDVNKELIDFPELINEDPYEKGWLLRLKIENIENVKKSLLTAENYIEFIRNEVEKD